MLAYSGHIMTLANSIIGVGILAMPFCFQKCGIVLSVLLLIISNWITRICCHYLIKSSLLTRRRSFEFLGFHAFGSSGKLLAELCIIGYLFGTSITYFVVMGDLGPQIVTKMFSLNSADFPHLRTWVMIAVTVFCILPLAMLKNVDSLSTVCAASIGFYVCLVVKIVLESEAHIVTHDWVEKVEYWRPAGILQCLPIFSMALSCQMQLFEVFESINNQSVEKLNGIVRNATWICTFVYIAVGFFGYVAFCTQTFSGNILMNFSPSFGSDVIKVGFVLSVAFSFPLVIFPCRASIYSLLYRKGHTDNSGYIPETRFKVITTCLVGCALCIALMIPSVELVIGLVGSTIGVAICIMFPAFCFRKIVKKDSTERSLAQFIFISGFCLMILGTFANLNAIDEQRSGAHLHVVNELENTNLLRPTDKIALDSAVAQPQIDKLRVEKTLVDLQLKDNNLEPEAKKKSEYLMSATPVQTISQPAAVVINKNAELPKANAIAEKPENTLNAKPLKPEAPLIVEALMPKDEAAEVGESIKQPVAEEAPSELKPLQQNPLPHEAVAAQQPNMETLPKLEEQNAPENQQPQTIDKDAIKKDEEIAAEELKNGQKLAKSNNDVELKETRKELKKTKELLERTVDQLKHELAKQNEETQNMVAETLEKVVQKVEQIEKKVQHNAPAEAQAPAPAPEPVPEPENKELSDSSPQQAAVNAPQESIVAPKQEEEPAKMPNVSNRLDERPSLLSILSEQQADVREPQHVYEPLSYKTGELIEKAKNGSHLETRLPLPLAVLFNASSLNTNNKSNNVQTRDVGDKYPLNATQHTADNANATINLKTDNATQLKANETASAGVAPPSSDKEKENVEAIRREILQLKSEQLKEFPTFGVTDTDIDIIAANAEHIRRKRANTPNFAEIDTKMQSNNCLTTPKVDQMLAQSGISNAINLKSQTFGRELRSVREENESQL
ncbi:putative sodium-coupled neutral amino acid transporter 10 isoform X1 [Bactrocera tryoni]|uniref:putative sodium-coupled neutral amino acid transporter 10 isoform X1 n=2 Tax=Bactrocera tryoni TaxID=59916 RepID=UPI001A973D2F|nr:putative sodium-coupled neutral amino acid transporter 10 isoform X1 [Bactrocera tryoni]